MAEIKDDFSFEQDGKIYNLYNLPKGFVIKGSLTLSDKGLKELPDLSEIVVEGCFDCDGNELTSLKGFPKKVTGDCICSYNKISTLDGFSSAIGHSLNLDYNEITSLKGFSANVGDGLVVHHNTITSFSDVDMKKMEVGYISADNIIARKYKLPLDKTHDRGGYCDLTPEEMYKSPVYQKEFNIDSKIKSSKMKVLRAIAKDNVSDKKGEVKPKRSAQEKKNIKLMLDNISKGIND